VSPEKERIQLNFCAAPLRNLWLSLIPKSVREEMYENASAELPSKLITTSIFCLDFWNSLSKKQRSVVTEEGRFEILPDRAWFAIRSLLKGGNLGFEKSKFKKSDFAQLEVNKPEGEKQIPRKWTSSHFSDQELELIIILHQLYETWKNDRNMYDDLDIVKTALKYWHGNEARNSQKVLPDLNEKARILGMTIDDVIRKTMSFGNERFQFKAMARKTYEKLTLSEKNRLLTWLKKWENKEHNSTRVGSSKNGYQVWKQRLSHKGSTGGGRIFFTPGYFDGLNNGKVCLQIYDFTFDHDYQDKIIQKLLRLEPDPDSEKWVETKLHVAKGRIIDTPGTGPSKPLPGPITIEALDHLDDPSNITLDIYQKKAIAESQPLLIDGLAGTGKTAVLSKRGAFRAGYEQSSGLEILISSSKAHVSKRLIHDIETTINNTDWKGVSNRRKFNYMINGFERNAGSQCTEVNLSKLSENIPSEGYDEIILDECQDLTGLEFTLLTRLCIGNDSRRLTIAGDPLQTLNPTGFDWGRIKAMFQDIGVMPEALSTTEFHRNYRSQRYIVDLANAIQNHRNKLFPKDKHTVMEPDRDAESKPILLKIDNSADGKKALSKVVENAEANNVAVICWAPDDPAVKNLLEGENPDDLLSEIWRKMDHKEIDIHFRTKIGIHSSSSIKGGEYKQVLLYKFASNPEARASLQSLQKEVVKLHTSKIEEKITISYAYSRLYVAITRALDKIYFVEDDDGYEFWQNLKIADEKGVFNNLDKFIIPKGPNDTTKIFGDLGIIDEKVKYNTFIDRLHDWETQSDPTALQTAIRLGTELMKRGDTRVHNDTMCILRAELYLRESKETTDPSIKKKKFEKAIALFEEAGEVNRIAPIKFEMGDWGGCLIAVEGSPVIFLRFIGYYCRMQLGDLKSDFQNRDEASGEVVDLLKTGLPPNNPKHWTSMDLTKRYGELKVRVNKYLIDCNRFRILYENVEFFGIPNVYAALPNSEYNMIIELFEQKQDAFGKMPEPNIINKYVNSLVKFVDEIGDSEEKIRILNNKSKKSELDKATKRKILTEIAKIRIAFVEKSEKIEDPDKNVFDGKRKVNRGLFQPDKLNSPVNRQLNGIFHLIRIKDEIDVEEFIGKFGKRIYALIEAIQSIEKENDLTTALKQIYNCRFVHKKSLGSIRSAYLEWIDNDVIDHFVKSLLEGAVNLKENKLFEYFFDYSLVTDLEGYDMYLKIIRQVILDIPTNITRQTDLNELKQIFTQLCEHILQKGTNVLKSEKEYISKFLCRIAWHDSYNNIESKTIRALKASKLPLDTKALRILEIISFEINNYAVIEQINTGTINRKFKNLAEEYITLLLESHIQHHKDKAIHVKDIIPVDLKDLSNELKQCESIEQFYTKLNRVIENNLDTAEQVIELKLFVEVFNKLEAELEDLSSNQGHASWEILCKKKNGSNFDMLFELCNLTKNPVNILTVCQPKWSIISLIKKYSQTINKLEHSFAGTFMQNEIQFWANQRMQLIQSKITTGKAKRQKTLSENDVKKLQQLNMIQGSIWGNPLIDNMVTYLIIKLAECDVKQLNNILSEQNLPRSGGRVDKIKHLVKYCDYAWEETFANIIKLK